MKIVISGASSGIGRALAEQYAKHHPGKKTILAIIARRSEHLQSLADLLQADYHVQCVCYSSDVRDATALAEIGGNFIQRFGAPNLVIANAGVSRGTLIEHEEDISAFQTIMDINVMGMVHTFQPFITAMKQASSQGALCQLVGVASVAGIRGLPGAGAYCASKAAAICYLESLRIEMQPYNIFVTTIAPGYVRTPMTEVNAFHMPFLMAPEVFAQKFAKLVARKTRFAVIPWPMAIMVRLMRLIPTWAWDWATRNAPTKQRTHWEWL